MSTRWYDGSPEADARWDAQEEQARRQGAWVVCPAGCRASIPERDLDDHLERAHMTTACRAGAHACSGYCAPRTHGVDRPCRCSCHDERGRDAASALRQGRARAR